MGEFETVDALAELYIKHGHVYVTAQGYASIHFYVKSEEIAEKLGRMTGARVEPHRTIFDVIISRKKEMGECASRILTELALPDKTKQELVLIVKYAQAVDKRERLGVAYQIKALRPKVPDAEGLGI